MLFIKILQINTVISYGSTGKICRDIYDVAIKYGHDCVIAYGRGEDLSDYNTIKIGNNYDNYVHFLKSFVFDRHGFSSTKATNDFIEKIENYDPDIIQLHNLHGYYLNIKVLFNYLKRKKIPVVWLLHDTWAISGGPASFILDIKDNKIVYSKENFSKNEYPKTWKRHNFQKNLNEKKNLFTSLDNLTIVTPSKWLNRVISKSFLAKYKTYTIYNGIDTEKFTVKKSDILKKYKIENYKILLSISSVWTPSKGLEFISKLPSILNKECKIVMIGVDEETKRKLPKTILALPRTDNLSELINWYNAADIFINPTMFDNFPTVNIESLACGTPIITYDTGGSGEAIDKYTGKIIPRGDEDMFIEAIKNWPTKNQYIINKCINRSKLFDKNDQYFKYLNIYESLIK